MKVRFKPNPFLGEPYLGQVTFERYGQVKEVDEAIAVRILTDHPYAFERVEEEGERVLLRRLNDGISEPINAANVSFEKSGDAHWVGRFAAMELMRRFPDSFEVVRVEELEDLPLERQLYLLLQERPHTLAQAGQRLGLSWRKLAPEVSRLIKNGLVEKSDDKPAVYRAK